MKKFLPIFLVFSFFVTSIFLPVTVDAATAPQQGGPNQVNNPNVPAPGGRWVVDPEVTFIGKNTARAGLLLDWTLQNYNWVCVKKVANRVCDNANNPIAKYWSLIVLYIVVPLLFFVILATSVVIIVTRGRSLTIMRFLPRFVAVVLLIVFSYSMVQFFYQFTDLIQGFFLRTDPNKPCPPDCISQKDLLYVGWSYKDFVGLRLLGDYNAESAFMSLLLAKLTALTYFVMVFLLLVRKIILWFFVIVSPIFPILLLYYPVRNTGKIWIGEFFRWLMYAPLFAIFLKGLVFMWRSAIPLVFVPASGAGTIGKADQIVFPTAVNILLGGPKQFVTQTNSVNLTETFALYVVSLLMLWTVILLPWVLLQIFLEYSAQFLGGDAGLMKNLVNFASKPGSPVAPAGGKTTPPIAPGGGPVALPFGKKFTMPKMPPHPGGAAKELPIPTALSTAGATKTPMQGPIAASVPQAAQQQALNMANMKLPSIRDIAKFETSMISKDKSKQQPVNDVVSNLAKIANPASITNTTEREKFQQIRDKLVKEKNQGNQVAAGILNAAKTVSKADKQQTSASLKKASTNQVKDALVQVANPATVSSTKSRQKLAAVHEKLSKAAKENNSQLASSILSVNQQSSATDVEKIREKLMSAKNDANVKEREVASTVTGAITGTISQAAATKSVKTAIQEMKDPASSMHQTLVQASKQGNQLASQILSFNDQASEMDVESLHEKIMDAKLKGDPIATQLAEATEKTAAVPQVNRIQQVRNEDYQAVKAMWKENYNNLEIPDGMSGSRTDWIKDDVANIDEIVGMLSSTDQEVVTQGLQEVSNILPFLMVGGFSQTEIIAYLKAKQDAAKEVAQELVAEEETKVSVEVQKKAGERTMAATMEEGQESGSAASAGSSGPLRQSSSEASEPKEDDEEGSLLTNMSDVAPSQDSTQKVSLVKKHLTIKDIAQYERGKLSGEKDAAPAVEKVILEKLVKSSEVTSESEKKRIAKLHDALLEESKKGNALAEEILSTQEAAPVEALESLSEKLKEEGKKEGSLMSTIMSSLSQVESEEGQGVTDEEYDEVEKLWEENYKTLPVPQEFNNDRVAWINADSKLITDTSDLLRSPDAEKKKEGSMKLSQVMPYLIVGGFSQNEILKYIGKKLEAANNVIAQLKAEEETKVQVDVSQPKEEEKVMHAPNEEKDEGSS